MGDALTSRLVALVAAIGEPPALAALAANEPDWTGLLALAGRHGVEGALLHALAAAPTPPLFAAAALAEHRQAQRALQAPLWEALADAAGALAAAGLPVVALKGVVLAERLYPAPELRPSTDVDLLVAEPDFERAVAALGTVGYFLAPGPGMRWLRTHHHQVELTRGHDPVIDLHFRLSSRFGRPVAAAPFVERSAPHAGAVAALRVLDAEDEALYLAAHAAAHGFARLGWLLDLRLLAARRPLDWRAVGERAAAAGLEMAVRFAVARLGETLGAAAGAEALAPPPSVRAALAERLRAAWTAAPGGSARDVLGRLLYSSALCDRADEAALLLRRDLGRLARRRAHRYLPGLAPTEWSA